MISCGTSCPAAANLPLANLKPCSLISGAKILPNFALQRGVDALLPQRSLGAGLLAESVDLQIALADRLVAFRRFHELVGGRDVHARLPLGRP